MAYREVTWLREEISEQRTENTWQSSMPGDCPQRHRPDLQDLPTLKKALLERLPTGLETRIIFLNSRCTSFSGRTIGDIKLNTDGKTGYTISGSNRIHGGSAKAVPPDNVWTFELDERTAPNN
jgi:hypothetical protein